MTWCEVRQHKGGPRLQQKATMRLDKQGYLKIALRAGLLAALRWRDVLRLRVERGEGEDAGRVRLTPDVEGAYKLCRSGGAIRKPGSVRSRVVTMRWDGIASEIATLTEVHFRIIGGGETATLELEIPRRWLLAKLEAA